MQNFKSEVKTLVETLKRFDQAQLLRAGLELSFQSINENLSQIVSYCEALIDDDRFIETLLPQQRNDIVANLNALVSNISSISRFSLDVSNPRSMHSALLEEFNTLYASLNTSFINAYRSWSLINFSGKGVLESARALEDQVLEAQRELEKIRAQVKQASSTAGLTAVESYAASFQNDSNEYAEEARKWLFAVIGSGAIILLIGFDLVKYIYPLFIKSSISDIDDVSIRLVLLSTALYGIRFASRNYSARKHLQVINRHRANVLATVEAIIRGIENNPELSNTLYVTATAVAFNAGETGMITNKEGAGGSDDNQLLNIIKTIQK